MIELEQSKLPVIKIEDVPDMINCNNCNTLNYVLWQIEIDNKYDSKTRTFYFHCSNPLCRCRINYFYVS